MYTPIVANTEQIDKLISKHLKPGILGIPRVIKKRYSWDSEDGIGFVTLHTRTGKKVEYQMRNNEPMFASFTGFGDIRYDVHYPSESHEELHTHLKAFGMSASDEFWKGAQI